MCTGSGLNRPGARDLRATLGFRSRSTGLYCLPCRQVRSQESLASAVNRVISECRSSIIEGQAGREWWPCRGASSSPMARENRIKINSVKPQPKQPYTYMDAPSLQGLSLAGGEQEKIAVIHPAFSFSALTRLRPSWNTLAGSSTTLRARGLVVYVRFDQPRSDLSCHQQSIAQATCGRKCGARITTSQPQCAAARTPCAKTTVPRRAARSCWPWQRQQRCDAGDRPICPATSRARPPWISKVRK